MEDSKKLNLHLKLVFLIWLLFFSYAISVNIVVRQRGGFFSDEASYFSITQSIAYDFDLKYTKEDIYRIKRDFGTPQGLFLKKSKDGSLYFSKSFIYPLFAAPFYRIFKTNGFFIFHSILLFLILFYGFKVSEREFGKNTGFFYIFFFIFGSIAWIYFFWITADFFNFATVFLAYLIFFYHRGSNEVLPVLISAFLLGVATFSKPPNIALTIPLLFLLLFKKRSLKSSILFSLSYILPAILLFGFLYSMTGDWNFMGGERKSFYYKFPLEQKDYTFDNMGIKMTASNYWERYYITPKIFFLNLIYFFIGRYTGAFIYLFPGIFFMLLFLWRRERSIEGWLLLLTYFVEILIYTGLAPDNYFGGAGSLGNRYSLNFYPLLFFFFPKNINLKKIIYGFILPVMFLAPAFFDPIFYSGYTGELSKSGLVKLFPPEITQILSIPTNINPHTYRKRLVNSNIFILNNNFNAIREDRGIWIYESGKIEFVLETREKCKILKLELLNNPFPEDNLITIRIGGRKKKIKLKPNERKDIFLYNIKAYLKTKSYFYYYGYIKTTTSTIPFYTTKNNKDRRRVSLYFKPIFEKCAE